MSIKQYDVIKAVPDPVSDSWTALGICALSPTLSQSRPHHVRTTASTNCRLLLGTTLSVGRTFGSRLYNLWNPFSLRAAVWSLLPWH